jgi:hypothetical protein
VRDQTIVGVGGLGRCLSSLDRVLAITIGDMLNRVRRKRGIGGDRAVALGDEVAEADYTSLGHWCVVSKEKSERTVRRDS